jgi:hypothetical protein
MIEKIQFLRNYIYEIIFKLSRLRSFLKDSIFNLIFYRNYNRDYFSIAIVARLIKNHIFIFDRKYFDTLLIAFYISKIKFLVFHFFLDFSVKKISPGNNKAYQLEFLNAENGDKRNSKKMLLIVNLTTTNIIIYLLQITSVVAI